MNPLERLKLTLVFSWLPRRDLLTTALVCKTWREIAENFPLWNTSGLKEFGSPLPGQTWKGRYAQIMRGDLFTAHSCRSEIENHDNVITALGASLDYRLIGGKGWMKDNSKSYFFYDEGEECDPNLSFLCNEGRVTVDLKGYCHFTLFKNSGVLYFDETGDIFTSSYWVENEGIFLSTREKTIRHYSTKKELLGEYPFPSDSVKKLFVDKFQIVGMDPCAITRMDRATQATTKFEDCEDSEALTFVANHLSVLFIHALNGKLRHWCPGAGTKATGLLSSISEFQALALQGNVLCAATKNTLYLVNYQTEEIYHQLGFPSITAVAVHWYTVYVATYDEESKTSAITTLAWRD